MLIEKSYHVETLVTKLTKQFFKKNYPKTKYNEILCVFFNRNTILGNRFIPGFIKVRHKNVKAVLKINVK